MDPPVPYAPLHGLSARALTVCKKQPSRRRRRLFDTPLPSTEVQQVCERSRDQHEGVCRAITFILPPSASPAQAHDKPPTSPSSASHSHPSTSFLGRIGRKLSHSRTTLVRRVSKGGGKVKPPAAAAGEAEKRGREDKENVAPSVLPAPSHAAPTLAGAGVEEQETQQNGGGAGAPLKRAGLTMRRTKSEAQRGASRIGAKEQERVEELVRRTEGEEATPEGARSPITVREDWTEVHSNLGSYFYNDALGVCWDGREQVHPDLLFSFQPYTSNSDTLPAPLPPAGRPGALSRAPPPPRQQHKYVYASTLSSFPPRPPLKPELKKEEEEKEETPAERIRREWRERNVTREGSLCGDAGGEEEEEDEGETPRPGEGEGEQQAATPVVGTAVDRLSPSSVSFAAHSAHSTKRLSSTSTSASASAGFAFPPRLSPTSLSFAPSHSHSSAYSTPTSEPAQFQFFSSPSPHDGEEGEEEGARGARMSSEGSETSLESIAAEAGPGVGQRGRAQGPKEAVKEVKEEQGGVEKERKRKESDESGGTVCRECCEA
ncbi:hypothetical protein JCM10213_003286 [Rhodosporidiobolus nylandii]